MKKVIALGIALTIAVSSFAHNMSNAGIAHLKKHESCSLKAYWDADGYSIGWGHHTSDVKKGMTISQSKADKWLKQDIAQAEQYANWLIKQLPYKYNFSQGFYDGLVDLVYNAGVGNVKKSTFYSRLKRCRVSKGKINQQDWAYTLAAVKTTSITEPGHKARRADTYKMMSK